VKSPLYSENVKSKPHGLSSYFPFNIAIIWAMIHQNTVSWTKTNIMFGITTVVLLHVCRYKMVQISPCFMLKSAAIFFEIPNEAQAHDGRLWTEDLPFRQPANVIADRPRDLLPMPLRSLVSRNTGLMGQTWSNRRDQLTWQFHDLDSNPGVVPSEVHRDWICTGIDLLKPFKSSIWPNTCN
jgi:hypothetical protein